MPRKKTVGPDQLLEAPPLALPPARPYKHGHGEREKDAYEAPPGSMPIEGSSRNERIVKSEPSKTKMTADEKKQQVALRQEREFLTDRYHRYLDLCAEFAGRMDYREQACVALFGITPEEAAANLFELVAEVHRGKGGSEVTKVLERYDVDRVARIAMARKWLWSDNAAASINAMKILEELDGGSDQQGSFEVFLRTHKLQKGIV